jgi:hypothetical protein
MKKALTGRPTRAAIGVQLVALAAAVALGIARGPSSTWDLPLIALLAGIAAISDLTAVETPAHRIKVSGSFLTIVVAIVLVGASAAAIVSVVSIAVGWTRTRYPARHLLINLVNYAWFPLIAGAAFEGLDSATGLSRHEPAYYLAVFALSLVALAINFAVLAAYMSYEERSRFWVKVRRALVPLLPSELASALLTVGVVWSYQLARRACRDAAGGRNAARRSPRRDLRRRPLAQGLRLPARRRRRLRARVRARPADPRLRHPPTGPLRQPRFLSKGPGSPSRPPSLGVFRLTERGRKLPRLAPRGSGQRPAQAQAEGPESCQIRLATWLWRLGEAFCGSPDCPYIRQVEGMI